MNPVTTADIAARWRPLSAEEEARAQAFLDDAWAYLSVRLPLLDGQVTDGSVSPGAAIVVVTAMVLRVLRNPDGKVQESIDDYTYRRADVVADGLLYATGGELRLLTPGTSASTGSVRLVAYGDV